MEIREEDAAVAAGGEEAEEAEEAEAKAIITTDNTTTLRTGANRARVKGAATTQIPKVASKEKLKAAEAAEDAEEASIKGRTVALITKTREARKIFMTGTTPNRPQGTPPSQLSIRLNKLTATGIAEGPPNTLRKSKFRLANRPR